MTYASSTPRRGNKSSISNGAPGVLDWSSERMGSSNGLPRSARTDLPAAGSGTSWRSSGVDPYRDRRHLYVNPARVDRLDPWGYHMTKIQLGCARAGTLFYEPDGLLLRTCLIPKD